MMDQVGSYEAKTHLPALLTRVAKGEQITITRHGVPIARLVPVDPVRSQDTSATIDQLRVFRQGRKLGQLSLGEMIREGRRF